MLVVLGHVGEAEGWNSSGVLLGKLLCALIGNSTVPFMFVSGFLFQHLSARFRYGDYLARRFRHVVLPYLIVSIPALVYQYVRHVGIFAGENQQHPVAITLLAYATGAHMPIPLWYIPVIVLFYLTAPLFLAVDRDPAWFWVIVPATVVAMFLHRSHGHRCVWQSALYFLPVYLTGVWASHYREALLEWVERWRWWLLATAVGLFVSEVLLGSTGPIYSQNPFSSEKGVVDLDLPVKLLFTLLLLEWLRRHDATVRGWLAWAADASFGLFFLHEYVIQAAEGFARMTRQVFCHPGLAVVVLSPLAVLASTMLGVRLVQRILGKWSRLAIGC